MILTVNANAAIDHVLFVDSLAERGTIRSARAFDCVGGKGADTALALGRLGAPHRVVSFMAGAYGRILENLYQTFGIQSELVWVEGETRTVTVIIETGQHKMTQISQPGYTVTAQDCARFLAALEKYAPQADWCAAAGSLPGGAPLEFYGQVCERMHRAGVKVLIDASGAALLNALPFSPEIIKLNQHEFQDTFGLPSISQASLAAHARQLIGLHHLYAVIVTLGDDGMLLVSSGAAWHARGPYLTPVNPAGAGDAASAAFLYRQSQGDSLEDSLRWACAAGAAVVQTEATADFSLETLLSRLAQIQITSMEIA